MSVIVAMFLTISKELPDSSCQAQSADNAFPIYRSPPSSTPPTSEASCEDVAKVHIFFVTTKYFDYFFGIPRCTRFVAKNQIYLRDVHS